MGKINEGIRERHERLKNETYTKIREAVQYLVEDGRQVTRANITKESGLSPSTFSKQHVKDFLLKEYGVGVKSNIVIDKSKEKNKEELIKIYQNSQSQLEKANKKIRDIKKQKNELEKKVNELEIENKILRGELDIAQNKIFIQNSSNSKGKIINFE